MARVIVDRITSKYLPPSTTTKNL